MDHTAKEKMASSLANESMPQVRTCNCSEGDKNFWNTKAPESSDIPPPQKCPNCQTIKSGWLLISSKGIGWTSWKKRWFVLSNTSLVFYRCDPSSLPQKGTEANPTLGGIDLNNSGSVDVKEDKKLLTVFFPDGQDGRTFTLKGETLDELQEWRTALETALAQAPSAGVAMGQNGLLRSDSVEPSSENGPDEQTVTSMVIGRPVLLALEDVDGSPAFLEKALRFIEDYGIKVEGILRQSADVELVLRRVQEYEQGKDEFSSDEDGHVIGDCIKYVLREMPSSPIPASCCTALVEAYKTDRGNRLYAIRRAIFETFPEPNLHLLQRILKMMLIVESYKSENRMSMSALAACMAPLLLRPLLAGDCEFEDDFNMGGDSSLQLLKAAAAANHAQAIVIIMMEEYERIFDDGSCSSEIYTESEEDYNEDDESSNNDTLEDDGSHVEDDLEHSYSGTVSGGSSYAESDRSDNQEEDQSAYSSSYGNTEDAEATGIPSGKLDIQENGVSQDEYSDYTASSSNQASPTQQSFSRASPGSIPKFAKTAKDSLASMRRPTKWGHTSVRKNLPMEPVSYSSDDENVIQSLETIKSDLQNKIEKEVQSNAVLRANLGKRKDALYERRLALEKEVERLRQQLQKERDMKESLESGLMSIRPGHASTKPTTDSKTRADIEEINLAEADIVNLKQKAASLRSDLSHQVQTSEPLCTSCKRHLHEKEKEQQKASTNDASTSNLASRNAQAQKQELTSPKRETSQKSTQQSTTQTTASGYIDSSSESSMAKSVNLSDKISNKDQTILSQPSNEDVKTKSKDSSTTTKHQPDKKKRSTKSKDKMMPSDSRSIASNEEQTAVVMNAAPQNSTSVAENSLSESDNRSHSQGSLPLEDKKQSQKLMMVSNDSSSKKSTTKGEKPKFGGDTDSESSKAKNQSSPTVADAKSSDKQSPQEANQSKSTGLSRNFASKKSAVRADKLKKESQDSPNSSNSNDTSAGSSLSLKDAPPSALSRLTNRLHFLKERRLQLVNELQTMNSNPTSSAGPQPPPRTYSR